MINVKIYCEIILFCFTIFFYCKNKDFFNPSVVVCGLWAVILLLYNHYDHGLYPLSDSLYTTITVWALLFSLTAHIFKKITFKHHKLPFSYSKYEPCRLNIKIYNIIIICNILLILSLFNYGHNSFDLTELRNLSIEVNYPFHILLLNYINQFSIVYTLGFVFFYGESHKTKMFILCFVMLVTLIFKTNKTGFIVFFMGILFMLKQKKVLTLTRCFYIMGLLLGFMIITAISRGDTESLNWTDYTIIYLLSPLPAMDMILGDDVAIHYGNWGSATFRMFYKIGELLGFNVDYSVCNEWVQVPLPTNVYTTLKLYYLDFGYIGIWLFAITLGVIWGVVYRYQKKDPAYMLFYASMIYSLFVQFFGDYFFGFLSVTIQCYVFSFIIIRYIFQNNIPAYSLKKS